MVSRERFRDWLLARRPDEPVGVRQQTAMCPLATFLRASGYRWAQVSRDRYYVATTPPGPPKGRALPAWAERFVEAVDTRGGGPDVTAGEALHILDEVTGVRWSANRRRCADDSG